MKDTKSKFEIRVRCQETGEITLAQVTREELCHGIDGKDMCLEDIGQVLLNDLRAQAGLDPILRVDEDVPGMTSQTTDHRTLH